MLLHHITLKQILELESIFAYLTKDGWIIPEWLTLLRKTTK